jgi:hypothetical protein
MAEPALPIFRSTDDFLAWEERQAEREPDCSWRSRHYRGLDVSVPLAALAIELTAAEIYTGVDLGVV